MERGKTKPSSYWKVKATVDGGELGSSFENQSGDIELKPATSRVTAITGRCVAAKFAAFGVHVSSVYEYRVAVHELEP